LDVSKEETVNQSISEAVKNNMDEINKLPVNPTSSHSVKSSFNNQKAFDPVAEGTNFGKSLSNSMPSKPPTAGRANQLNHSEIKQAPFNLIGHFGQKMGHFRQPSNQTILTPRTIPLGTHR